MSIRTCVKLRGHLTEIFLQLVTPKEATDEVLLDVHTPEYLQQLKTSKTKIAQVMGRCQTIFSANSSQALYQAEIH